MSQKWGRVPFPPWLVRRATVGCSASPGPDSFSFVCFWNFHGVFDQNSLRLRRSDPLYIHRNATKRLHWVWVPQRTSASLQHVLWVTPYLSLHSSMSGTGFTTVFCVNLVSFRRSQASGTWGWCHRLLLWFAGLRRCLSKADAGRRVHGVRNALCMSWPAYLLPRKQVTRGASKLNCQAVCSFVSVNEALWQIAVLSRTTVVTSGRKSIIIPIWKVLHVRTNKTIS